MAFSVNSTQSALVAFGKVMGVTANNIANVETENYKKDRAVLREGANGDVEVEISKPDEPASHTMVYDSDGKMREIEVSNTDVAEEMVDLITTQRAYEANITVMETLDGVLGTIIDMKG